MLKRVGLIFLVIYWGCNQSTINAQQSVFSQKVLPQSKLFDLGFKDAGKTVFRDSKTPPFWYTKMINDTIIDYFYNGKALERIEIRFDLKRIDTLKLFALLKHEHFEKVDHFKNLNHDAFVNKNGVTYIVYSIKSHLSFVRRFGEALVKQSDVFGDSVNTDSATTIPFTHKHKKK
jgi:hypothetical protein